MNINRINKRNPLNAGQYPENLVIIHYLQVKLLVRNFELTGEYWDIPKINGLLFLVMKRRLSSYNHSVSILFVFTVLD